ncbi:unnamed protein product, partial [Didymodactylos carnosus]
TGFGADLILKGTVWTPYGVGRHTAVNILNEFDKVIKHYNIGKKIVRIVTDNASNNLAAFNSYDLPGFEEIDLAENDEVLGSDRNDDEIDTDIDDNGFNCAPDDAFTNKNDNDIVYIELMVTSGTLQDTQQPKPTQTFSYIC